MRKFKRVLKYNYKPSDGEKKSSKPSKTVKGQSLSIREMLVRNANGLNFDNFKTPFYEDQATFSSEPINVIQNMDLVEKLQYLDELQDNTQNLRTKIDAYKKEQDALAAKEAAEAAQRSAAATTETANEVTAPTE